MLFDDLKPGYAPKYNMEEVREKVRELSSQGLPKEMIQRLLKMSFKHLDMTAEFIAELDDLIHEGFAMGGTYAGSALMRKVREGDLGAIKWFEQSRGYRRAIEDVKVDISGSLDMTDEVLDARLKEIEDRIGGAASGIGVVARRKARVPKSSPGEV